MPIIRYLFGVAAIVAFFILFIVAATVVGCSLSLGLC